MLATRDEDAGSLVAACWVLGPRIGALSCQAKIGQGHAGRHRYYSMRYAYEIERIPNRRWSKQASRLNVSYKSGKCLDVSAPIRDGPLPLSDFDLYYGDTRRAMTMCRPRYVVQDIEGADFQLPTYRTSSAFSSGMEQSID
jgi:hypothetical protein